MNFHNRPLAIASAFVESIDTFTAASRSQLSGAMSPAEGSGVACEASVGVMTPETNLPLASRLLRHLDDDHVVRIALYVNSPGGTVDSTPELASVVRRVNEKKRVDVFTESYCCSGAMWVASQATSIT